MAEEQNEMFENTVKRTSRAETTREKSVRRKPWAPPIYVRRTTCA